MKKKEQAQQRCLAKKKFIAEGLKADISKGLSRAKEEMQQTIEKRKQNNAKLKIGKSVLMDLSFRAHESVKGNQCKNRLQKENESTQRNTKLVT